MLLVVLKEEVVVVSVSSTTFDLLLILSLIRLHTVVPKVIIVVFRGAMLLLLFREEEYEEGRYTSASAISSMEFLASCRKGMKRNGIDKMVAISSSPNMAYPTAVVVTMVKTATRKKLFGFKVEKVP